MFPQNSLSLGTPSRISYISRGITQHQESIASLNFSITIAKLNQTIAIEKGIKSCVSSELTELYKTVQKPELFKGFSKVYQKRGEEAGYLVAASKRMQFSVDDMLEKAERTVRELMDVTVRKEWRICGDVADITVNGITLRTGVPGTYLLFMEKQLTDCGIDF